MLSDQLLRRLLHEFRVQRVAVPAGTGRIESAPRPAVVDQVTVTTGPGAEARMTILRNAAGPAQTATRRQVCIGAEYPGMPGAVGGSVEMDHLADAMDTGIRASGTDHSNRLVSYFRQGALNFRLDARRMRLPLPAGKAAAVVLNARCNAHRNVGMK